MTHLVRNARPGDFDAIFDLLRLLVTMADMGETDRLRLGPRFTGLLDSPDFGAMVVEEKETVLGVITISRRSSSYGNVAWIDELSVAHSAQGHGYGRILCNAALNAARARWQAVRLGVATASANHGAQRFYPRAGFILDSGLFTLKQLTVPRADSDLRVLADALPPSDSPAIRPSTVADLREIGVLSGLLASEEGWQSYLAAKDALVLTATAGGRPSGMVSCAVSDVLHGRTAWIDNLTVLPAWNGQGLGTQLAKAGLSEAMRRWQPDRFSIATESVSESFLEELGFHRVGVTYALPF